MCILCLTPVVLRLSAFEQAAMGYALMPHCSDMIKASSQGGTAPTPQAFGKWSILLLHTMFGPGEEEVFVSWYPIWPAWAPRAGFCHAWC